MNTKEELIIVALQQRIGEMAADYETKIAMLRAELTQYVQANDEKQQAIEDYSNSLEAKMAESV